MNLNIYREDMPIKYPNIFKNMFKYVQDTTKCQAAVEPAPGVQRARVNASEGESNARGVGAQLEVDGMRRLDVLELCAHLVVRKPPRPLLRMLLARVSALPHARGDELLPLLNQRHPPNGHARRRGSVKDDAGGISATTGGFSTATSPGDAR